MVFSHVIRWPLVLIALTSGIFFSCASNISDENSSKTIENLHLVSGKSLFLKHCAICHGENGKLGASGAKDLTKSTLDSNEVIQVIKYGKNGMPPMAGLLGKDAHVGLVVTHVIKLRH